MRVSSIFIANTNQKVTISITCTNKMARKSVFIDAKMNTGTKIMNMTRVGICAGRTTSWNTAVIMTTVTISFTRMTTISTCISIFFREDSSRNLTPPASSSRSAWPARTPRIADTSHTLVTNILEAFPPTQTRHPAIKRNTTSRPINQVIWHFRTSPMPQYNMGSVTSSHLKQTSWKMSYPLIPEVPGKLIHNPERCMFCELQAVKHRVADQGVVH